MEIIRLLEEYKECDMFSLTGVVNNYNITEDKFLNALNILRNKEKEELREFYIEHQSEFEDYPSFDELYLDIEKECYEYNNEDNKKKYLEEKFDNIFYYEYKKIGMSDKRIEEIRNDFFKCNFISGEVGRTTKYGNKNPMLFVPFYSKISMLIDRENSKNKYCFNTGKDPIKQIPRKIRKYCIRYEISFFNSVTISSGLMINYYFPINEETKKYLLKFKSDFDLDELDDLALYKNNEVQFYSCTHEKFNSKEEL